MLATCVLSYVSIFYEYTSDLVWFSERGVTTTLLSVLLLYRAHYRRRGLARVAKAPGGRTVAPAARVARAAAWFDRRLSRGLQHSAVLGHAGSLERPRTAWVARLGDESAWRAHRRDEALRR